MSGPVWILSEGRLRAALRGVREPIVVVLFLIAFFTTISGKPLDGMLMLIAGLALAWDAGRRAGEQPPAEAASAADPGSDAAPRAVSGPRRLLVVLARTAASLLFAVVVGSFARYSWPATAAVVVVGIAAVVVGWQGPVRRRADPGPLPRPGAVAWGGVLVAGGLWELWSLLHQPTLTTSSYAHPTISTLTDPVLASAPGRALVLALWLALGWYLVER